MKIKGLIMLVGALVLHHCSNTFKITFTQPRGLAPQASQTDGIFPIKRSVKLSEQRPHLEVHPRERHPGKFTET